MRKTVVMWVLLGGVLLSTSASAANVRFQAGLEGGVAFANDRERNDDDIDPAFGYGLQLAASLGLNKTMFLGLYLGYAGGTHHPAINNDADIVVGMSSVGTLLRMELTKVNVEAYLGYAFGTIAYDVGPALVLELDYGGFQFGGAAFFPFVLSKSATIDLGPYLMISSLADKEERLDSNVTYVQLGVMIKFTFGSAF